MRSRIKFALLMFAKILTEVPSMLACVAHESTPKSSDDEELFILIEERRKEILAQKESSRPIAVAESLRFQNEVHALLVTGNLKPIKLGGGGVYFLYDAAGKPQFVIKPVDESVLCLHNPKGRMSPFNDSAHRLRKFLPLYQTTFTEAAVYAIASACGIEHSVPETHLMILRSPQFFDISENQTPWCSTAISKEKLCSVQRFVHDSIDLNQAMHEWFEAGLENIEPIPLDQRDFEEVLLLLWLIFDGDGHSSNFRIYFKTLDEQGKAYYGIKKIDCGLSLPERNAHFLNYLSNLPNARMAPSRQLLDKISHIDEQRCLEILHHYLLFYAEKSFLERLEILKEIAQRPSITLEEIDLRFEILACVHEISDENHFNAGSLVKR